MTKEYTMIPLANVLNHRSEFIQVDDLKIYKRCRVQLYAQGVTLRDIIQGAEIKTKKQQICRAGELLVAEIDAKIGGFGIVPEDLDEAIVSSHYFLFNINDDILNKRFLEFFIRTPAFLEQVRARGSTNYAAIRPNDVLGYTVPLPPQEEQQRIVARIEELAAKIEEARGLRKAAVEEAEALISSLFRQKLAGSQEQGRLGEVLLSKPRNGWSAPCDNVEIGVPVLTLSAVTGFRYKETAFKRTSEATDTNAHYWLNNGDLLITRSNTPKLVGHAAIYNGSPSPCIYPDLMMKLEINDQLADREFVLCWLRSTTVRNYIYRMAKGTSPSMKKINQTTVTDIPFPTHLTLTEQREIVTYLNDLQAKVDALKQLQAQTSAELEAMLPSVLDKAFKGDL